MRGINRVLIVGYVGQDPELLLSSRGTEYARLNIATHRARRKDDGDWEDVTDWHRVQVWGPLAKRACRHLAKGSPLAVEGHLSTYRDKDEMRGLISRTSVVADEIHFLPSRTEIAPGAASKPGPDPSPDKDLESPGS